MIDKEMELSDLEIESINMRVNQIVDTYHILNTTLKPEIFFQRLGFLFDTLLSLQKYEKYGVFTANSPTKRIKDIEYGLEDRVHDFICRYMSNVWKKSAAFKTEKVKRDKYKDFVIKLISAFDCADSFWEGNKGFPHYTKPLFTKENYAQVQAIYDEMCDKDFDDMIIYF